MFESNAPKGIDILGAHRGGEAVTKAILDHRQLPSLDVRLVDPVEGRAASLARRWASAGFSASSLTADSQRLPWRRPIDILALCTDDPQVQANLLRISSAPLTVVGIVLATNDALDSGGLTFGIGAVVPHAARHVKSEAVGVLECIEDLTNGNRVSSRAISSAPFNMLQIDHVRNAMYTALAVDIHEFLLTGSTAGRVVVSCAWPPADVTLTASVRERAGRSRLEMRSISNDLQPGHAVIYRDIRNHGWMFAVLPMPNGLVLTPELPDSSGLERATELARIDEQVRIAGTSRGRGRNMYVTD